MPAGVHGTSPRHNSTNVTGMPLEKLTGAWSKSFQAGTARTTSNDQFFVSVCVMVVCKSSDLRFTGSIIKKTVF